MERGRGIAVFEAAVPDVVHGLPTRDESGPHQSLHGVLNHASRVDDLNIRLRHLRHKRPVSGRVGHIARRVVREHRHPVERTVVLGEVDPALAAEVRSRAPVEADADDVGRGVA